MQLREHLPFDVREVMATLPRIGEVRHAIRQFTLNPRVNARARSVKTLAQSLGFSVEEVELPEGMNGRLTQDTWDEAGYRIEVNRFLSVEAKRFAVLHEMGHFYRHLRGDYDPFAEPMHFDPTGQTFYLDKSQEREANEWAEAVLFGGGQLAAAVGLHGTNLPVLAKYFGVTQRVVEIALSKLK